MRFSIFCFAVILFTWLPAEAQQKWALIVGIDQYAVPAGETIAPESGRIDFPDLHGCHNDALSIQSLIMTRYGFEQKNTTTLFDREATRIHIFDAFTELLSKSAKGDIVFFYYAGHGSQVFNSLSKEADHRDESIVPSDTWKKGVKDITDKELNKYFSSLLDKGVNLTVIFDCCHSGSITRGPLLISSSSRYMTESNFDSKDSSIPIPLEHKAGDNFLLISACQDNEAASEITDDNNIPHGALTISLLEAINQQPVDISVLNLFAAVRAILLQYNDWNFRL